MEKVWLKNYEPGVPFEIDADRYPSIAHMFLNACQRFKDRPAFENLKKTLTFSEVDEKASLFAAFLQGELKLQKGDRIALMMPNLLQYPVAMFGAFKAGLVVVNVNPLYTPRELEFQLANSQAKVIVVLANFAHTVEAVLPKTAIQKVIVTEVGDLLAFPNACVVNWVVRYIKKMVPPWHIAGFIPFRRALKRAKRYVLAPVELNGKDIAYLQYTGGTTGRSKGAVLTHRNMIANIEQASSWIKQHVKVGEEIIITALPLYHIFSLMANVLTYTHFGALNVLVTNPRDIKSFIRILRRFPFTAITGVNTLFNALLQRPEFSKLNFSSLRCSLGGGMALQKAVADKWKAVTGNVLLEAYGLTETCPAVCINPLNLKEYNGSIGLPIPSTNISIRNEAGEEQGFNEAGELWVQGPQVMKEYWHNPEETQIAMGNDWLRTGDIASVDEQGFVKILDRKKDMILISGFNVYPNEVEEVIAQMPEVLEVVVIGVPGTAGEKVKAFIVKRDPNLTPQKVIDFCRKQLTAYKVPKEVEFRQELPKSNVGKILRRALRAEAAIQL